jgi:tetratricopeptide (TPR) repeat protein
MKKPIDYKKEQLNIFYRLYDEEKWVEARTVLFELINKEPDNHWLFSRLASTYYEERKYEKALEYSEKALHLKPHCPLVLWDYAGELDMLGRDEEAIIVYKKVIHRGVNRVAYEECGEGIRWARSLVNDCSYRLGLAYASIGDFHLAGKYIKRHIANRNRNCSSIYNLRTVKRRLTIILEGKDPRKV